jgi:hypothetical protein
MTQLEGHISAKYPNHILKLNKALYGLKQSARIWYNILKEILINKFNFENLLAESVEIRNSHVVVARDG